MKMMMYAALCGVAALWPAVMPARGVAEPPARAGVTTVAPIVVEADEITVREIVERTMSGERSKLVGHQTVTYTLALRAVASWSSKRVVNEDVYRVYEDATGYSRRVFLAARSQRYVLRDGEWVFDKPEDPEQPDYRIREEDVDAYTRLPFYFEEVDDFEFEILDRTLDNDRVIFHVSFRPKSPFSKMPRGEMYVDSRGYRVIHEIYQFNDNPMPMLIKGLNRASVQWEPLPDGEWVPKQFRAEIDLRGGLFGLMPEELAVVALLENFSFDEDYDERLFGKRDGAKKRPSATAVPDQPAVSARDTTTFLTSGEIPETLRRLWVEDDSLYTPLARYDARDFVTETVATHDSLGLSGLPDDGIARDGSSWTAGLSPAVGQWEYDRVEGLVLGGEVMLGQRDTTRTRMTFFGGYATGPEAFRYRAALRVPVPGTGRSTHLSLSAGEYAAPFGSNRPALNSVRAFIGGADDRDYLIRRRGMATLGYARGDVLQAVAGLAVSRERSATLHEDFSLFGDMGQPNPAVDEGTEHAAVLSLGYAPFASVALRLALRSAGGALGGDVRYHRTDLGADVRHFFGRHEVRGTIAAVITGDDPPLQRRADIGGLSTVRGYPRRHHVGNHSLATRVEYRIPYDPLAATRLPVLRDTHLQFIPWTDAARVGEGDSQDWIASAGLGLQMYLGPFGKAANLRFDAAFPIDDASVHPSLYLWFEGMW
jgi:hypothetical protein